MLSPGLDHRLDDRRGGRAKLAAYGIAPPGARTRADGPVGARRCRCAARSAAASTPASPAASARPPASRCGSAGPAASPSTTSRRSDVRCPAAFHPLRVAAIDDADRRRRRAHLRRARTSCATTTRFVARPAPDDPRRRRRSAAATRSARRRRSGLLRIGVKRLPGGAFSEGVARRPAGRRRARRDDAGRPVHHRARPGGRARRYVAIAAGSGITPVLSIVAALLEGEPDAAGHAGLRQPHPPHGDVPRRAARPQGPLPRRGSSSCTCSPARQQDVELLSGPARRRPAAPDPRRAGPGRRRRRRGSCAARSRWWSTCAQAILDARRCAPHRDPHRALPRRPGPAGARSRRWPGRRGRGARDDPARRPRLRASTCAPTTSRVLEAALRVRSDLPFACRAASAAPAGPSWSRAAWRWTSTTPSSPRRSSRATCSPASRTRRPSAVVLDYDA